MNKDEILKIIQDHKILTEFAEPILHRFAKIRYDKVFIDTIRFEDNLVIGEGTEPWQYGDPCYYEMPIDYLWDPEIDKRLATIKLQKEEAEREQERRLKERQEANRRAQYEALKKIYE